MPEAPPSRALGYIVTGVAVRAKKSRAHSPATIPDASPRGDVGGKVRDLVPRLWRIRVPEIASDGRYVIPPANGVDDGGDGLRDGQDALGIGDTDTTGYAHSEVSRPGEGVDDFRDLLGAWGLDLSQEHAQPRRMVAREELQHGHDLSDGGLFGFHFPPAETLRARMAQARMWSP